MEELKNEKKRFDDKIYVITDEMDAYRGHTEAVGWFDSKGRKYYNLDEVQELYENEETENVFVNPDGKLSMRQTWLVFRIAFTVQCGIPFGDYDKYPNLLEYAKKVGIVANNPRPIKMLAGIKTVNEYYGEYGEGPTGTYKITYKINDEVVSSFSQGYLTKIANGFINRITQGNNLISLYDKCEYYEWTHTIYIYGVSEKDMEKSELIEEFKVFDMELLMLKSNNFATIMDAYKMACRDQGQYQWIKEKGTEDDEKKSNYYWHDKTEKKEKNEGI